MPSRSANNHRYVPDAFRNYDLTPSTSVVNKQSKYTPQVGDTEQLKLTAQGLSRLAKGITDANYVIQKQANEHMVEVVAATEEKNRKDWAKVSKHIDGMAKFNPYNKEAYKSLRAKANMEQGIYQLAQLESTSSDLTFDEFEKQRNSIIEQTVQNMNNEGLKAKHTAGYLTKLQDESFRLKDKFVTQRAEKDYKIFQNQTVSSVSKDIATLTYLNPNGFIAGWNEAIKNLEDIGNSVGMETSKQVELFYKSVNQYLIDNVDDIDTEDFMIALTQTSINGKPLSDFDPNYAENMKQLLVKAKRTKFDMDRLDLEIEKHNLEKASLTANAEIFKFMTEGNKSDAEIENKAMEIIEAGGMEAVGFTFLHKIVGDKATLLALRTTQTSPEIYEELQRKYITGTLSQNDILIALDNKQLSAKDATLLFNTMESKAKETYAEEFKAIKELYLDTNATYDLGTKNKTAITKAVFDITSNSELSKADKAQALIRIKGVAEHMQTQQEIINSKDPTKLLTAEYMKTQKVHNQSIQEAQRYLAKLGLLRNQMGNKDTNIKVTSSMQEGRRVTLADGTTQIADHKGTDITTGLGRTIYTPKTGRVVASGYEKSMGNYVLFECAGGGYIKLMHLQSLNLPAAGTHLLEGTPLALVGNSGNVTTKNTGILHVECFDKRMRLVDPKQFIKGK